MRCSLHYSIPKEGFGGGSDRGGMMARTDWNCSKCGVNNFRRRDSCFKCSASREEAEASGTGDGYDEISSVPTNTLLLRNLDVLTTEERVLAVLGQTTNVPIKSLKVARDPVTGVSRGFCYVELHTVSEAAQLDDLLLNLGGQFYIDGRQVLVAYARKPRTTSSGFAAGSVQDSCDVDVDGAEELMPVALRDTLRGVRFADYVEVDTGASVCGALTDEDIIAQVAGAQPVAEEPEAEFCTADDNLATCGAHTVEDIVEEVTCEVADSNDDGEDRRGRRQRTTTSD
ncbi:hypothetical protein HPB52_008276 [Rhipicephalus sanguineus]|uniref:RanBP2-type domain-containing protein n=1 Tax=Rhipicephalus sanguineus TaxID=34632 RepID=A0A9D4T7H7_RHISA|nr:hypothetical protein HPB52_008276 [Rhipicephalus sanguineus]